MADENQFTESNFAKLKQLFDIARGRKDVKQRIGVLSDPENLDTMSILSKEEADFLAVSNWLAELEPYGGMFAPLQSYAQSIRAPSISVGGMGRQQAIDFVRAMNEAREQSKIEGKEAKTKESKP